MKPKRTHPQQVSVASKGMVTTQHYLASEAGAQVLRAGGNAIDAAVAAAFALCVCEPQGSGLGGQTMMLLRLDNGRMLALDGSSRTPSGVSHEKISKEERLTGYKATTVPSTPAALAYALKHYGTKSLKQVLTPAIELAEKGYPITQLQRRLLIREKKHFQKFPSGMKYFFRPGGKAYRMGEKFVQKDLAKTLKRLARYGIEDFYQGRIARKIEKDMQAHGGFINRIDLAQIPWPLEREPLKIKYRSYNVVTFPPPGAGRTLIEVLNILENFEPRQLCLDSVNSYYIFCEAFRLAFIDREDRPFDPNFYPQVRAKKMMSKRYARSLAVQITRRIATNWPEPDKTRKHKKQAKSARAKRHHATKPGGETSHLSVMDKAGNIVALTQSIERVYGAKVAADGLGFLYNNYLFDYEYKDIRHPYFIRPNTTPWATVAPTIIFKRNRPYLVLGSPGSERIFSSIVQVFCRVAHKGMPLEEAIIAPRFHCSIDSMVSAEAPLIPDIILRELEARGFKIEPYKPLSFYLGCVQAIEYDARTGRIKGAADPRRDGAAIGIN